MLDGPEGPSRQDLITFVESCNGFCFTEEEAVDALSGFKTKKTKPVTTFRGPSHIGDSESQPDRSLKVNVWAYLKTSELKLPTAKKCQVLANGTIDDISIEKLYKTVNEGEINEEEVQEEDRIKAFKFGKTLVPITEEDEEAFKLPTEKAMHLLGFVKMSDIQQWYPSKNTMLIIPDPTCEKSHKLFMAIFIRGLSEKNSAALVRYCRIANASPQLGFLIPKIGKQSYCIWVPVSISTYWLVDDVRRPSLKTFVSLTFQDLIRLSMGQLMPR